MSASLGSDQLSAGLFAALVGLLLVVLYSFIYYRGLGVVSVSSLVIAALLTYLSVVLLTKYEGFTLSLAGIAGLIVAIGITADSFIVYFERLRDEVREGRSLRSAVERGWTRARRTILVSDTVSFLAALLLYILSIGDVRGFAFTLGLTTLIDVVVVFLFTKPMITLLARTKFYGQGHRCPALIRPGSAPERHGGAAAGAQRPAPAPLATAPRTLDHHQGGVMSRLRAPFGWRVISAGGCTAARSPSTSSAGRSSGTRSPASSCWSCILRADLPRARLQRRVQGRLAVRPCRRRRSATRPAWSRSSPNGGTSPTATEVKPFDGQAAVLAGADQPAVPRRRR